MRYDFVIIEPAQPEGYLLPGYHRVPPGLCYFWKPAQIIQTSNSYQTS